MCSIQLVETAQISGHGKEMREMRKHRPLQKAVEQTRVKRIQEHATSSAEEDDWSPNTIYSVNQKIHSTRQMKKNGPGFFTLTALVKNRPIKFIMDSGSPVTLIPKSLFNRITPLKPVETEYRDVNDNRMKPFTRLGLDEETGNNAGYR